MVTCNPSTQEAEAASWMMRTSLNAHCLTSCNLTICKLCAHERLLGLFQSEIAIMASRWRATESW